MLTHFSPQLRYRPLILEIDTTKPGSASNTFVLPLSATSEYNFVVAWGDGVIERSSVNSSLTHIYPSAGVYVIKIWGKFPRVSFNNTGDKLKLIKIIDWGDVLWFAFANAFYGCTNLSYIPTGKLNTKNCSSFSGMFFECSQFNFDVGNIDTQVATTISGMFYGCSTFNNQINFVTHNVTNMSSMMRGATAFKQDLSMLAISSLTNAANMLHSTDINDPGTTTRYDALLNSWAEQSFKPNVPFHGGNAKYSAAASAARAALVAAGWTITDGGLA